MAKVAMNFGCPDFVGLASLSVNSLLLSFYFFTRVVGAEACLPKLL